MIEAAHSFVPGGMEAKLTTEIEEIGTADFTIASGIFNMKFEVDATTWRDHIVQTLDTLARASVRGFAFNMLTIYSDREKMRPAFIMEIPPGFSITVNAGSRATLPCSTIMSCMTGPWRSNWAAGTFEYHE